MNNSLLRYILFTVIGIFLLSSFLNAQGNNTPLTNSDVIEMLKAGLPESTIILSIQQLPTNFDTSTKSLIELKQQGATAKILDEIVQTQTKKSKTTEKEDSKIIPNTERVNKKTSVYDYNFELISCVNSGGDSVFCTFSVINKTVSDRKLYLRYASRMIDETGREYVVATRTLGNDRATGSYDSAEATLIPEVSMLGTVKFERVSATVQKIKALRLNCYGADREFNVDFLDIPIANRNQSNNTSQSLREVMLGINFYKAGDFEQSYNYLSKALAQGDKVSFQIKHRHPGPSLGMDSDLCAGNLVLSKDFLEFQSSTITTFLRRYPYHDFKVSLDKIKNITVSPQKWGKLSMRVTIPKNNNKEEEKEFNFFSEEASLLNTSRMQNGQYYEVECNQTCTAKANLIKRLLDEIIANKK